MVVVVVVVTVVVTVVAWSGFCILLLFVFDGLPGFVVVVVTLLVIGVYRLIVKNGRSSCGRSRCEPPSVRGLALLIAPLTRFTSTTPTPKYTRVPLTGPPKLAINEKKYLELDTFDCCNTALPTSSPVGKILSTINILEPLIVRRRSTMDVSTYASIFASFSFDIL